jgi:hypothetical protein
MSAAAARRKKQLTARHAAAAHHVSLVIGTAGVVVDGDGPPPPPSSISSAPNNEGTDPIKLRLDALLYDPSTLSQESVAYEALQLAQSVVRRYIKLGSFDKATHAAYTSALALLTVGGRVAVCSQLLTVLVNVLNETHTSPTTTWITQITELDIAHQKALNADSTMLPDERGRLQRLQLQFLRKIVKWSADCGTIKYGNSEYHALLADHAWRMSCDVTVVGHDGRGIQKEKHVNIVDGGEEDDDGDGLDINLRNTAVTHYAFAAGGGATNIISTLLDKLQSLPAPTSDEVAYNHTCPPCQRDALLTRTVLVLLSIENLRDATLLVRAYLSSIEGPAGRSSEVLTKSYLDKTDGVAPSHVMFCCMLLRICEKDAKTAPLFTWLVRNFGNELGTMIGADSIRAYTTRIGRVYFDIVPPPSMMSMMENMFSGGGMGGMPGGGMNPAAMMQAMQAMQGGGRM